MFSCSGISLGLVAQRVLEGKTGSLAHWVVWVVGGPVKQGSERAKL